MTRNLTQVAGSFIGTMEEFHAPEKKQLVSPIIHITDSQTAKILDTIPLGDFWDDNHHKSLKDTLEYFEFRTFGDKRYSQYLEKMNRIIIPDEDGTFIEFVIFHAIKYRLQNAVVVDVYAPASYLLLKKAKVIKPQRVSEYTASQHLGFALNGTEWRPGIVESGRIRTLDIENHTNPYAYIRRIANEFELEPRFRIETDGNKVVGRYVDLLERVGGWQGREVEFGRDLLGIGRKVDDSNVVTALIGLGPERDDGTRLEVFVEDEEALQRWGIPNQQTGELMHLIETYEPESTDQDMTVERLTELTRNELEKRINSVVEYTADVADLEKVPGMENKKIRFGDTIKIKDMGFNPPLYLEARVHTQDRSLSQPEKKKVTLGDYIEYTEEEVHVAWKALQNQIRERLAKLAIVNITASAGTVFKNGVGSTDLKAVVFQNGQEVDESGTLYDYKWDIYDKDGNFQTSVFTKQVTVNASDVDEKATYIVTVSRDGAEMSSAVVTLTNVFDGEDGKTLYTWVKYADDANGNGMSDTPDGKEYIGLAYNKETPNESNNPKDYTWAKIKGEQGIQGPKGADGQTTYTWVKYADDENGNGMSDSPDGKLYIGLAFNKTTPEESNNPADYTWSLMPQNIEIGGRNLLKNTSDEWTTLQLSDSQYYFEQGTDTRLEVGVTYTFSILVEKVSDHDVPISVNIGTGTKGNFQREKGSRIPVEFGKRFTLTFTITENDIANGYEYFAWRLRNEKQVITIRFKEVKLEKGNKATDWTPAPEDIEAEIEKAKQDAKNAQETADGKNTVFYQASQPSTVGRKTGDVWFDTDDGYRMYRFDGSKWVATQFGSSAFGTIDAGKITVGTLKGINIEGVTITGSTFTTSGDRGTVEIKNDSVHAYFLSDVTGYYSETEIYSYGIDIKDHYNARETHIRAGMLSLIAPSSGEDDRLGTLLDIKANTDDISIVTNYKLRVNTSGGSFMFEEDGSLSVGGDVILPSNVALRSLSDGWYLLNNYNAGGNSYVKFKDDGAFFIVVDGSTRHTFYAGGTKSGGSIEIDGQNLGMSPIDSPQILIETIEFDIPLSPEGTVVLLDERFAKAVNHKFAVFPNNGKIVEKGENYFIIIGEGFADCRIVGERVGYEGIYFDNLDIESEEVIENGLDETTEED